MKLNLRRRRRPFLALAVIAAVATPMVACATPTSTGTETLGAGKAVGPVPVADLQKFYAQKLEWGPCTHFAPAAEDRETFGEAKFECTYLQVPLDYSQPNGKIAQIAVLRQKASAPDRRIGSLVINPGGPGASGTESATNVSTAIGNGPLAQRFDLVGFDPRGVGASKPVIHCFTPAERDADRADDEADNTPAGVARLEQKAKDYDAKCEQRSGRDLLANAGTRDVVKDMDVLRSALGDAKLNYLGYSYGTRLGYSYAEEFPGNVRTMVLDGALDPDQGLIDRAVAQSAGFQHAFDAFAASCAAQPDCPLGPDPKAATENFRNLVIPLIHDPFKQRDGRNLSYSDAMTGVIQALYSQQLWQPLQIGLQELALRRQLTDRPTGLLMLLADLYQGRQPDGSYQYTLDAFTAIGCVDDKPVTDPAVTLEADKRAREAAPFRDDGRGPNPARDVCAFWPVPNTSQPHEPRVAGLPQVLVVSGTGDPATPYEAGVNLAKALNARLLTVENNQHTVVLQGASQCVDDIVTKYYTDLALPPDGSRCAVSAS
jgi:pimeloyl-ACP methyl ester carboxylesterase